MEDDDVVYEPQLPQTSELLQLLAEANRELETNKKQLTLCRFGLE